jgi:hypothetical protein
MTEIFYRNKTKKQLQAKATEGFLVAVYGKKIKQKNPQNHLECVYKITCHLTEKNTDFTQKYGQYRGDKKKIKSYYNPNKMIFPTSLRLARSEALWQSMY